MLIMLNSVNEKKLSKLCFHCSTLRETMKSTNFELETLLLLDCHFKQAKSSTSAFLEDVYFSHLVTRVWLCFIQPGMPSMFFFSKHHNAPTSCLPPRSYVQCLLHLLWWLIHSFQKLCEPPFRSQSLVSSVDYSRSTVRHFRPRHKGLGKLPAQILSPWLTSAPTNGRIRQCYPKRPGVDRARPERRSASRSSTTLLYPHHSPPPD